MSVFPDFLPGFSPVLIRNIPVCPGGVVSLRFLCRLYFLHGIPFRHLNAVSHQIGTNQIDLFFVQAAVFKMFLHRIAADYSSVFLRFTANFLQYLSEFILLFHNSRLSQALPPPSPAHPPMRF